MVKTALLHQTLPQFLKNHQDTSASIEVTIAHTELKKFHQSLKEHDIQALVVDLELLGNEPLSVLQKLEQIAHPEMTLVIHSFAKWDLLESIRKQGRFLLRAPVSPRALRSSMISLIVKNLTRTDMTENAPKDLTKQPAPARRFDDQQLMQLQQIRSAVDCECPNQVSDLVMALLAFEKYSHECKNKNNDDARMHAYLERATGHARAVMETALSELCKFENIDPDNLDNVDLQIG